MLHSNVHDYVIPGLTSSLVGGDGHGKIRLFQQNRYHEEPITPHSHRFDFQCLVLNGQVRNGIWTKGPNGDPYQQTLLKHHGSFGDQTQEKVVGIDRWNVDYKLYKTGELYKMMADEIHTIFFSRNAMVLFFEGPNKSPTSSVLEPVSVGRVIPTFKVEPWMFRREIVPDHVDDIG